MTSRVTVREIATAAGVSAATVSRALNDSELVAPETRRHIREIAARLGHAGRPVGPEAPAPDRRPAPGRQLAFVVPDIDHPSYSSLLKGASRQALREQFTMIMADSDGDSAVEAANARALADRAAGLILSSSRLRDAEISELAAQLPVVLLNRQVDGVPMVRYDSTGPIRRALEHLYAFGHRRIAYAGGPEHALSDQARRSAIDEIAPMLPGLEVRSLGHFDPLHGEGRSAADLLVSTDATAVLSYNDFIAVQIIARLRMRGWGTPEDMSVVGIDDSLTASVSQPALTSVRTPHLELGRMAVNLLLDEVEPQTVPRPQLTMPVALVVRDSTAAPRERDRR